MPRVPTQKKTVFIIVNIIDYIFLMQSIHSKSIMFHRIPGSPAQPSHRLLPSSGPRLFFLTPIAGSNEFDTKYEFGGFNPSGFNACPTGISSPIIRMKSIHNLHNT